MFGMGQRPTDLYPVRSYDDAARLYRQIAPIRGRERDPRPLRQSRKRLDSYALDRIEIPHPLHGHQLVVCYAIVSYKEPALIFFPDGAIGLPAASNGGTNWLQNEYAPNGICVYNIAGCKVLNIAAKLLGPHSYSERCDLYRHAALPGQARYMSRYRSSKPTNINVGSVKLPFLNPGWSAYRSDPNKYMLMLRPVYEFVGSEPAVRFVAHNTGAFVRSMRSPKAPFAKLRKAVEQQLRTMATFSGDQDLDVYAGNSQHDELMSMIPSARMLEVAEKLNHMVLAENWQPGRPVPERIMNYMMTPLSPHRWCRRSAQQRVDLFWDNSCLGVEPYATHTLRNTPSNVYVVTPNERNALIKAKAEVSTWCTL